VDCLLFAQIDALGLGPCFPLDSLSEGP